MEAVEKLNFVATIRIHWVALKALLILTQFSSSGLVTSS